MQIAQQTLFHTTHVDVALQLLEHASVARSVNILVVNKRRAGHQAGTTSSRDVDDEVFVELVSRCSNLRSISMRTWKFISVRPQLLSQCSFFRLNSLYISCMSTLTAGGLFGLLSLMPALKRLSLGRIDSYADTGSSNNSNMEEDLPSPACSLTHLFVVDDWNINFAHYPHLLSRSHESLEFLELQWIFDEEIAGDIVKALEHCTRLRHLTLVGNDFSNEGIIAACPSVSSLALISAPNDAELAALRAPLLTLRLENCFIVPPDSYVDSAWEQIHALLPLMPTLREIEFNLLGKKLKHETDLRREMHQEALAWIILSPRLLSAWYRLDSFLTA